LSWCIYRTKVGDGQNKNQTESARDNEPSKTKCTKNTPKKVRLAKITTNTLSAPRKGADVDAFAVAVLAVVPRRRRQTRHSGRCRWDRSAGAVSLVVAQQLRPVFVPNFRAPQCGVHSNDTDNTPPDDHSPSPYDVASGVHYNSS